MTSLRWILITTLFAAGCECGAPPSPCQSGDPPEGCGETCTTATDCSAGLHCNADGVCWADCTSDNPSTCPSGQMCTPEGRCVLAPVTDGSPIPRRDGDTPLPDNTCASVDFTADGTTPNVILIVDRSRSMSEDFSGGQSRWNVLRNSLLADDGLISTLQASVRFGLVLYTAPSSGTCPDLVTVPADLNNYDAIAEEYRAHGVGTYTPTGDSITAVLSRLDDLAPVRSAPTIIVLATDGEPNSCEMRSATSAATAHGRMESLAAVEAAYAMNVQTYVISVGTEVGEDHLQDIANAGIGRGPSDPDAEFWVATDTSGLEAALSEIIGGVVSCTLELSGSIIPSEACLGTVRLGDQVLPCDDPNGWRAIDATHIELTGTACDDLQSTGATVSANFPCTVIII